MGTKRTRDRAVNSANEFLPVPPGFVSLTAFTLKGVVADPEIAHPLAAEVELPGTIGVPLSKSERKKSTYSLVDEPQTFTEKSDRNPHKKVSLPKGVTWGCANCHDCVKVTARWHPEESHLPILDDAPVFRPTELEFRDTLKYISKIYPKVENYGICRIVPPSSWRSPCLPQDKKARESSKLSTCVQRIDGLQNLCLKRNLSWFNEKMETKMPEVAIGGDPGICNDSVADSEEALSSFVTSEFTKGPELTLASFKKNADKFKRQYFSDNGKVANLEMGGKEPLIARIENEYWRIISNPSEEVEVLCGTNLGNQNMWSGFPSSDTDEYSEYAESGWNLNNIAKLPGSLLRFQCDNSSSISNPRPFIGMCFSSQCWRTSNHHLYSISYLHKGCPKVWYGVPGSYYFKFVEITKKLFPRLAKHPKLVHELVTQISPSVLTSEGIPVYRCVQNPSEFVLIFPGVYHSEFSSGFTYSESVCFAPFDWLLHGQNIVEAYSAYCLKTSISYDKLLLGAALKCADAQRQFLVMKSNSANNQLWRSACGKDGILTKALKVRVKIEGIRRDHLCNPSQSRALDEYDTAIKRECCFCKYDLYLSYVCCPCSPNRFSCLRHSKQLCSCPWSAKQFIFRYSIEELNLLVESLEGNLKAIHGCSAINSQSNNAPQPDAILYSSSDRCNGRTSDPTVASDSNSANAGNNMTPGSNHRHPDTCAATGMNSPLESGGRLAPPGNMVILLSDDDED
ncbi:putative lysine-specific demethylase JMJ16 [Andrographis paniculata]|uniref:putative lysine-specific demethylase JMJ16 n=1 Tax=Andrographis paniculata TaxID=175694 RepID=UPI0021E81622|nr:putative lysine-specific demethylase JMJ16 [Andrographis paniculata]